MSFDGAYTSTRSPSHYSPLRMHLQNRIPWTPASQPCSCRLGQGAEESNRALTTRQTLSQAQNSAS